MSFPAALNKKVYDGRGDMSEIIRQILKEDAEPDNDKKFKELAQSLKGKNDLNTLKNIWEFVRKEVRYREDGSIEKIKSPARLLADRVGDCKSMALLTAVLVRNLGYKYFYRITQYDPQKPEQGHIYVIVELNGKEIPVDPVNDKFNNEPKYWRKMDTRIQRLRGLGMIPRNISLQTSVTEIVQPVDQKKETVSICCGLAFFFFIVSVMESRNSF